jgi:hypothetical protein
LHRRDENDITPRDEEETMRTYSFDHFKADKPEPSQTNQYGADQTPRVEQAKPQVPPSEEGQLHYGRQHAQTAELYHQRRTEREQAERMGVSPEVQAEPHGGEAPPILQGKEDVEQHAGSMPDESEREGLRGLAQQAVASVLLAAREAAKEGPLGGAKKLAGTAVSGVRRVAREVSARAGRPASTGRQDDTRKGPGKKK